MACSPFSFYTLVASLLVASVLLVPSAEAARAFFVFGDSLVDNGNNNYLVTTARADSPPYGIDYPTHRATGRFSNGLNIADIISEKIGSQPPLPILSPRLTGENLLLGANFASAGVGVLNDTGLQFLNTMKIYRQFELFEQYQEQLASLMGDEAAQQRVNQALYLIVLGGNDFVNNYFLPYSVRPAQLDLPNFANLVISEYQKILLRLYDLGARRVMVTGTGPLGCVPSELAQRSLNGQCASEPMRASAIFNPLLVEMLQGLNSELGSDVFVSSNTGLMQNDFIHNPQDFGFVTSKIACCGQGPYNGLGVCNMLSSLCPNRNIYAFWDAFHPTERANRLIVEQMMTASTKYMNPMNLSTILALDTMI